MMLHYTPSTIKDYIEEKEEMLYDFGIKVTETMLKEMKRRNSKIEIDNYCNDLIKHHLGCD